jgi:hypothetical protein
MNAGPSSASTGLNIGIPLSSSYGLEEGNQGRALDYAAQMKYIGNKLVWLI